MITCPKCNSELNDGTKFCSSCGTKIVETIFCPKCGKETSNNFAFCQSCGASLKETQKSEATVTEAQPENAPENTTPKINLPKVKLPKIKLSKKTLIFGAIGIAVFAVLILAISLIFGLGNRENNYGLYLKDGEIYFTDLKKSNDPWELTTRLSDDNMSTYGYELATYIHMSDNGKYIFYPDKVNTGDDGINLYYKEVSKPGSDGIKIASEVICYNVNKSITLVTYLTEDGNLYQYKISEDSKDKIASDVEGYRISEDGKKIIFINSEDSIYIKSGKKDKEKLASEVTTVEYVSADLSTVYYIKDDTLYKHVYGEDKVKITSDIENVIAIYDSGEIYYLKSETEIIYLKDHVVDDMADIDATLTEPEYPDYPSSPDYPYWWDYDTDAEYDAAVEAYNAAYAAWEEEYERIQNEYYEARSEFYGKQSRDDLRSRLNDETIENTVYSLYYYDGSKDRLVTDSFVGGYYSDYVYAQDAAVISYEAYNRSNIEKVKLSEIGSIYDVRNMVQTALISSSDIFIAVKSNATVLPQEKAATCFRLNSSGTIMYYIDNIADDKNYGDLYRISISKDSIGKPEVYDNDVHTYYCSFLNDSDDFKYFKDYKDSMGELYINKNKIDYDVYCYYYESYSDSGKFIYFTDWDDNKDYGTLKIYDGKETTKIAEDVNTFTVAPDGQILYLYDYSINYSKGELYEWYKGKTRKIDDDVACIIPVIDDDYKGYNLFFY